MPHSSLGLARMQLAYSSGDAPLSRFGCLRALDCEDETLLAAIRQPLEELFGIRITIEGCRKVWRHRYLARVGIELYLNFDCVTGGNARVLANFRADRKHEGAAHWGNRAAVCVPIDRDVDPWPLA